VSTGYAMTNDGRPDVRLCVVIVNYRTPDMTLDVLRSLDGQVRAPESLVVIVDNDSGDGSDDKIEAGIAAAGYGAWARVIRSGRNGGFSAGNNVGLRAARARYYLLLNSDTIVRPGALETLLAEMDADPTVGVASPRLEWPDGTPQESCFRDHDVVSEFLRAANTGVITKLASDRVTALPVQDAPIDVQWTSFACAMLRGEMIERVGPMDEGYFMYYEDADYCRAARDVGYRVRHFPHARVVHLRGGSSSVKSQRAKRKRVPRYFYAARARYFRKHYGFGGTLAINVVWTAGRGIHLAREVLTGTPRTSPDREWLDNWIGVFDRPE